MTETEWLACPDPVPMLEFLEGRLSDRKLRLFACACVRRIWPLLADERSRRAVEVAERFADGRAGREELAAACADADRAHAEAPRDANFRALDAAPHTAEEDLSSSAADAAVCAADAVRIAADGNETAREEERRQQAVILRCVVGNPFRPSVINPTWRTPRVVELARGFCEGRSHNLQDQLADALRQAGCDDADVLAHCHEPAGHVPGCWVADSLMDKG
jgi:hypothetical protein